MQQGLSKDWINMDFYKHLNYSIGNEDWNVERQALQVNAGDRAICVTASGDRPLHLLMTNCAEIISIDMNRVQNHLLSLKLAAISALDYEKYLAFLGCTPYERRDTILKDVKPFLPVESADFWESHKKWLKRGVIYQGRIERLTKVAAKIFHLFQDKKINTLFSFDDIESQSQFITQKWDTPTLHKIFAVVVNPKIFQYILNDPGLNSYVDYAEQPGVYIYQRMISHLHNHLAKKSALLQLLLTGKLSPEAYFPYLTPEGYKAIRETRSKINIITGNTIEFLSNKTSANQIDCFSMSDIASYMSQVAFENLLQAIHHASKPNARFCLREFISSRHIPVELQPVYKRNTPLEKKLENEESNFVYRFMVGEIQK
jgi:S-adenosylmethionine-diacylglycerol 3-amino-3-carboxypropyl transferase